ncbi:putative CoA-binding protein [Bradyrhizobium sp. LM6.9]
MEAPVSAASVSPRPWSPPPDANDIVKGIHAMLHPHNIVLVGATDKPGNYAERIWNNLVKYGYEGGLYPVNTKRDSIWGVPCYKDFASLPEKPDHVLVLVPARFAVQVIRDAAAAGARSATIVTSGFSELQDEGSQKLAAETASGRARDGIGGHRPELPRQFERRRKALHQYRRPYRHHGTGRGGDCRTIGRHRHGDPPGTGRSRRRGRLHGDDRQRGRARYAGPDALFRRGSEHQGDRGLPRRRAQHQGIPGRLQGGARREQTGDRAQARGVRGWPRGGDGAHRRARGLDRDVRRHRNARRSHQGRRGSTS